MRPTLTGLVAALIVLSACSSPGGSPTPTPAPSASASNGGGGGIEHPEGDQAVLVVSTAGGLVPVQFLATAMPSFVMLGDGRVIVQGAVPAIYPGPALPPLLVRTLTPDGVQAVLEAVEETGLFTSDVNLSGGMNMCADCGTTTFTLDADGRHVTVSVYALGMIDPGMAPPQGMSSAEVEAHRVLGQLLNALSQIDTSIPADRWEAGGWQPFEPNAFRLYVRDASGDPPDDSLPEQVRDWPMDADPATIGEAVELFGDGSRCFTVDGEDAATWLEELGSATQITRWTTDGADRYSLLVRPLLPYEPVTCPGTGAS